LLSYAKECNIRVPDIPAGALMIAGDRDGAEAVYFKLGTTHASNHPNGTRTVQNNLQSRRFTGLRTGELLGLTVADVDFDQMTVCPRKQADDRTRELRELKTKRSRMPIPITQETATVLRAYLANHWKENPQGLLFPNRLGRPRKRVNVVKFGLRPILVKLGLPTRKAGLHAFRHGLGTALANAGVSPAIVQRTLRHTDIKTPCGSTFTRTPRRSARRSFKSNHYKCNDYYNAFG